MLLPHVVGGAAAAQHVPVDELPDRVTYRRRRATAGQHVLGGGEAGQGRGGEDRVGQAVTGGAEPVTVPAQRGAQVFGGVGRGLRALRVVEQGGDDGDGHHPAVAAL